MNFQSRESDRHAAHHHNVINNNTSGSRRTKSKSTEDMNMGEHFISSFENEENRFSGSLID